MECKLTAQVTNAEERAPLTRTVRRLCSHGLRIGRVRHGDLGDLKTFFPLERKVEAPGDFFKKN